MSEFGDELARLMSARRIGVRELARQLHYNPGHISNLKNGKARPSQQAARDLDRALGADGALAALAPWPSRRPRAQPAGWADRGDDEIAAIELARHAEASDIGAGTVERLESAVDDLAVAYPGTPPDDLLERVRGYLGYTGRLLDARGTLANIAACW